MPDVTIRNETPHILNVAFRFVAPACWTNALEAGASWTPHLASARYTIEVRIDNGTTNRFSAGGALATAGDITGGWLAGAASVLGVVGGIAARSVALPLMNHAIAGTSYILLSLFFGCYPFNVFTIAGARFARNEEGTVITVGGVWIPFYNKTYAVRYAEDTGYSLWDVTDGEHMMEG